MQEDTMKKMIFILTMALTSISMALEVSDLPTSLTSYKDPGTRESKIKFIYKYCAYCDPEGADYGPSGLKFDDPKLSELLGLGTNNPYGLSHLAYFPSAADGDVTKAVEKAKKDLAQIAHHQYYYFSVNWKLGEADRRVVKSIVKVSDSLKTEYVVVCSLIEKKSIEMTIMGSVSNLPDYTFKGYSHKVINRWFSNTNHCE